MIVDITSEIITRLKTELAPIKIMDSTPNTNASFPCVVVQELNNNSYQQTKDSIGHHHSNVTIEINIFTNSEVRMSEAKIIRGKIDVILSDEYGMSRDYSNPIPNYSDESIYRYVLRYNAIVDKNRKIYGR